MSLNDAHAFAFSLAATLMVAIVIFQAGDGSLGVMPASEYDGDTAPSSTRSILSPPDRGKSCADRSGSPADFRSRRRSIFGYASNCAVVVVEGATVSLSHGRPPP